MTELQPGGVGSHVLQGGTSRVRESRLGSSEIDFDWLLKLRVAVARCGEMDLARWWNTERQLGTAGAAVLARGFPRTHDFAQARSVIAVARSRCAQVFASHEAATLWDLPEALEDAFDAKWEGWLEDATSWKPFFASVAAISSPDLVAALRQLDLVETSDVVALNAVLPIAGGRAVAVPGRFSGDRRVVAQLALGFSKGAQGSPVVPYARITD
ncbi:BrxE family protein [Roseococcus pinisoli]|uniref:BrxE family protein n=1 Tax=Roseococcus pinisoli TaxID=2835040 RepID=A0ABS5QE11_9PROT|nr:BrxE family protein [Roseococcus pinisoli]